MPTDKPIDCDRLFWSVQTDIKSMFDRIGLNTPTSM